MDRNLENDAQTKVLVTGAAGMLGSPVVLAVLDFDGDGLSANDARDVFPLPDYSDPPASGTKPFRMIAYVADGANGVRVVDIEDPANPFVVTTIATTDAHEVFAKSHYVTGDAGTPSLEHEVLFVADGAAGMRWFDVSDATAPGGGGTLPLAAPVTDFRAVNAFEPPANKLYVYAALGGAGCAIVDWSDLEAPVVIDTLPIPVTSGVDVERIQLDRLVDEEGNQIKDTSHDGARTFTRAEIERILGADY